jgi:hypothetical protein
MPEMTKYVFSILLVLFCAAPLFAGQSADDDSYEELFSQGIKETSEIAADTKLNIDISPPL